MLDLEGQGRVEQTSLEDTKGKGPTSRIIKRRNVGTNVWMDGCMVPGTASRGSVWNLESGQAGSKYWMVKRCRVSIDDSLTIHRLHRIHY